MVSFNHLAVPRLCRLRGRFPKCATLASTDTCPSSFFMSSTPPTKTPPRMASSTSWRQQDAQFKESRRCASRGKAIFGVRRRDAFRLSRSSSETSRMSRTIPRPAPGASPTPGKRVPGSQGSGLRSRLARLHQRDGAEPGSTKRTTGSSSVARRCCACCSVNRRPPVVRLTDGCASTTRAARPAHGQEVPTRHAVHGGASGHEPARRKAALPIFPPCRPRTSSIFTSTPTSSSSSRKGNAINPSPWRHRPRPRRGTHPIDSASRDRRGRCQADPRGLCPAPDGRPVNRGACSRSRTCHRTRRRPTWDAAEDIPGKLRSIHYGLRPVAPDREPCTPGPVRRLRSISSRA